MPERTKPFLSLLLQDLTDPAEAAEYIMAAREDSLEMFRTAIRDVAKAHQMASVAKRSRVTRENLYRAFSEQGNPTLDTLDSVLSAVGLAIAVVPKHAPDASRGNIAPRVASRRIQRGRKYSQKRESRYDRLQSVGQLPLPFAGNSVGAGRTILAYPLHKTIAIARPHNVPPLEPEGAGGVLSGFMAKQSSAGLEHSNVAYL